MSEKINGYQLYQAFLSGYLHIVNQREKMNRINVFPVRDGDTGSNMVGTLNAVSARLKSCRSAGLLLERIGDLSLEGARGNSGMILSQYLNGLARFAKNKGELTLTELGEILHKSVDEAYRAVENPMEGTMLSVLKAWSGEVRRICKDHNSAWAIMKESLASARGALERTPEQLAVLKEHRVVDAGALGIVSFLEGIVKLGARGKIPAFRRRSLLGGNPLEEIPHTIEHNHESEEELIHRYCTEVLLEGDGSDRQELRERLGPLGDSLIITEGQSRKRIHIHTNVPDRVVTLLRQGGRVIQQKADDMKRQEQIVTAPLGKIGIVTDSIADIPLEILDRYQVHMINMLLMWDEDEYLDRLTITPDSFYRMQEERPSFPSSTFPSAAQIERTYQYLLEHYEGLLVLSVSGALSGAWKRMSLSAQKFNREGKRITVVDTRLNSVAQGLLVKRVAEEAAKGRSLEELTTLAEDLREKIRIFVSVKTFKFMVKGGRVSPLKGFLAKLLNLKPIVSLDREGKGIALDKSFSSRGLVKKISALINRIGDTEGVREYALVHASDRERGEEFAEQIEKIVGKAPSYISDISPIVGMHSGKGAVAIGILEGKD